MYAGSDIIIFGSMLAGISLLYIAGAMKSKKPSVWLPKELIVAAIYTAGIWGFPLLHSGKVNALLYLFSLVFFLFVFYVLLFYAFVDRDEDISNRFYGMASILPLPVTERLLLLVLLLSAAGVLWIAFLSSQIIPVAVYAMMWLLSWFLFVKREQKNIKKYYRILGEGIFFVPGIVPLIYRIINHIF